MLYLNQTDINVYLQLAGSAYSDLAKKYSDDLKYSKKCTIKDQTNLFLLNTYIEMLECYQPVGTVPVNTKAIGSYTVGSSQVGQTINISINGIDISGLFTITSATSSITGSQLANTINAYQSTYVASYGTPGPGPLVVTITGGCFNGPITVTKTGTTIITTSPMVGGICENPITESDNCVTEQEMQSIIEKISILTGITFMPINFTYTPN